MGKIDLMPDEPVHAALGQLLDHLPDVAVFAKDMGGRFIACNQACAQILGVARSGAVVGERDEDFLPRHLCATYRADDQRVVDSGAPLVDHLELICTPRGTGWFSTTKIPLRDHTGAIVGVAGVTRNLQHVHSASAPFQAMSPVIDAIRHRYAEPLTVRSMAAMLSLSVSQFERRFRRRFASTPLQYLIRVRVAAACDLLARTDAPIAQIALETGFYDQSHLTNHVCRRTGMSPSRYRATHSRAVGE